MTPSQYLPFIITAVVQFGGLIWMFATMSEKLKRMEKIIEDLVSERRQSDRDSGTFGERMRNFEVMREQSMDNRDNIVSLDGRMTAVEGMLETGTRRQEELFRQISSLTQGAANSMFVANKDER